MATTTYAKTIEDLKCAISKQDAIIWVDKRIAQIAVAAKKEALSESVELSASVGFGGSSDLFTWLIDHAIIQLTAKNVSEKEGMLLKRKISQLYKIEQEDGLLKLSLKQLDY